jgi:hypothetical protein
MIVLNIAAGKFKPLPMSNQENLLLPKYILNVDTAYFSDTSAASVESDIRLWECDGDRITKNKNLSWDAIEFMERTSVVFDRVVIYRFLEHISFTQLEYFIYLVSTVLHKGGQVDVIVPNYITLAKMILMEEKHSMATTDPVFPSWNIKLTTELLNEPSCPHASIWTPDRMIRFWELEDRFRVKLQKPDFNFDGRSLYLRSFIERI